MTNSSSGTRTNINSNNGWATRRDGRRKEGRKERMDGRIANSQEFLDSMRLRLRWGLSLARFVCRSVGSSGDCAAGRRGTGSSKRISNFMYPRPRAAEAAARPQSLRCPSPSVVGRTPGGPALSGPRTSGTA